MNTNARESTELELNDENDSSLHNRLRKMDNVIWQDIEELVNQIPDWIPVLKPYFLYKISEKKAFGVLITGKNPETGGLDLTPRQRIDLFLDHESQ